MVVTSWSEWMTPTSQAVGGSPAAQPQSLQGLLGRVVLVERMAAGAGVSRQFG
jgi:hypothetical protein